MSISQKDVEHIAHLAPIELTEQEKNKFADELSAILGFIEKLNEVGTAEVLPMMGGTVLESIMRKDEQLDKNLEGKQAELVATAPNKKDSWIKVRAIFS